ncbi:MAG: hypothetical protein B7Y43_08860 [Sphingomonas sp. 28-62-20]|uniref:hypothetical protein n=1 Tax=Sphingomonas sp. 28-62-20 TaxID=1970433 RepID=UPI000BDD8F3D|nr:MAG: hypothetical protein B7Y43_08860 [Sphingomonas sp. 28-62-20]
MICSSLNLDRFTACLPLEEQDNLNPRTLQGSRSLPTAIVKAMNDAGFDRFTMDSHTRLWKRLGAKEPAKGYGAIAVGNQWCWYDTWLNRVREECEQQRELYA